jgi:hypothetical protein
MQHQSEKSPKHHSLLPMSFREHTMPAVSFILVLAMYCLPILARSYTLKDDFTGNNYKDFFNKFGLWTGDDPTNGYVDYVSAADAWSNGLLGNGGNIYLGVDHVNVAGGRGRKSVRLTSNAAYDAGSLFVVDVPHMVSCTSTHYLSLLTSYSPKLAAVGQRSGRSRRLLRGLNRAKLISSNKPTMPKAIRCLYMSVKRKDSVG